MDATTDQRKRQAAADLFDYINTLSAAEALAEANHMRELYHKFARLAGVLGIPTPTVDALFIPVLLALIARMRDGEGALSPIEPLPGKVHVCELFAGTLAAKFGL